MAELSVAHRAVLAQMLERVPDKVLKTLALAVAQMPGERARALSQMLADETTDRKRRAVAFAAMLPMFKARSDSVASTTFPAGVLPRLWKAASAKEPQLLATLDDVRLREDDPQIATVSDRICLAAAGVIRDQPDVIWPVGGEAAARGAGLQELAACFDLATLARRALASLPIWISRPDEQQQAELRLMIRDSAEIAPDGGPRMLEILFAHLSNAAVILRLVILSSRAAGKEGVLSESEMAVFVDRLIREVEARVDRIAAFKVAGGANDGSALRADIAWCGETLAELDRTLQLDPEGAWGKAAREARGRIQRSLSATLKSIDKTLDKVMPTRRVQTAGRMTREAAALANAGPVAAVEMGRMLLTIVGAIRSSAQVFGCEALRSQLVASVVDRITTYVDLVLEAVRDGEAPDPRAALALLDTLADYLMLIDATEPAKTARRRAAAALTALTEGATTEASQAAA